MKQEDRELLLKDLCVRVPYGVNVSNRFLGNDDKTVYRIDKGLNLNNRIWQN